MDKDSFISRITMNRRRWMYIARGMVPEQDCEDAIQSAILSAWEHLPQLKDERAFDAWFRQILINRCRQMQRGYRREKDILRAVSEIDDIQEESDLNLGEAWNELKPEEQKLIRLHHEQGYSLKELSEVTGQAEDTLKMRLYRARKRLKAALITLLIMLLLAAAAVGMGLIDVNWFLKNRRAEPAVMQGAEEAVIREAFYSGDKMIFDVNDAVWNNEEMILSVVWFAAGIEGDDRIVYDGNIGVDGMRHDHIWIDNQITPIAEWADGKAIQVFSVEGWKLGGEYVIESEDNLPDGKGETLYTEMYLGGISPKQYEIMIGEDGFLEFSATTTLKEYPDGTCLETGTVTFFVDAPSAEEWRKLYEMHHQ